MSSTDTGASSQAGGRQSAKGAEVDWVQDFKRELGLAPLSDRRASDTVAARLEQLISDGKLVPGQRIPPEREVAEMFGVSRSTVREALNQLSLEGLIDRRPGRGTIVVDRESSPHNAALRDLRGYGADLVDALDFRATIEPAIAGNAASRATRADLVRLEELLRFMDREDSPERFASLDRQFHELIARSCHNPLLVRLSELASTWFEATRHKALQTDSRRDLSRQGHRRIYAAIAEGDPKAATAAMADHIGDVVSILSERLRENRPRSTPAAQLVRPPQQD